MEPKSGSDRSARDRFEAAANVSGVLAAISLAAMMLLTAADVVLRAAFELPIHGTFEMTELLFACTVFLALPMVVLRGENLIVNVIDECVKPGVVRLLDLLGAATSLALLLLMAFQMVQLAYDMHLFGDVTADLSIPKIVYWVPVLLGVIGSALTTLAYIARRRHRH